MRVRVWLAVAALWFALDPALAQKRGKKKEKEAEEKAKITFDASLLSGIKLRLIGPAITSGRIADFAVNPENPANYFAAVASGGVWVTENSGVTWKPVFDSQGSYSIGCIAIDPHNPLIVWVGTGENNSQRSVGYGDGVYKSIDGGKSWKNVGLKQSEHIGRILVDPRDSNVVYVAAQGPLWSAGGERGLYKTTDGGETWERVLEIDEHTGVSEVVCDPRDPDTLYAVAYQRRRHVWTLVNGGPGSGLYKSTDGGANWRKINRGLPGSTLGRIGIAISPVDPDRLYAVVEAAEGKGGFFRSDKRGESWAKQSGYVSRSPQYYQELFADPHDVDRVYSMDVVAQVTEDGGRTFRSVPMGNMHVDVHAWWIDPKDPDHLRCGNDGGVYESFDRGANWRFMPNLPITQFYKVAVDNDAPFYNVFGGTQDNFSLMAPSRTTNTHGITNRDWTMTLFGDGFQSRVDPTDPNIIYAQLQYGRLVRYDRRSGERIFITPIEGKDEPALRWNWDSPLIISPHDHKRLYFAANILFRSDDRGNSWRAVSPDLSAGIDRNQIPVMGRIQSVDAPSKNRSTSVYGNIVALSESPLREGLLAVGTDDGLIQISEDGGDNWRKLDAFPGVPAQTYVNRLETSKHDENVIYAAFNNHKNGDFKPYILKSEDLGASWRSIAANLPERGSVYAIAEDHVRPDLLFVGTEFGLFASFNGGGEWTPLKGGLPTVAVRDLAIQERENDLVVGTFGRGIYILDDYAPLRAMSAEFIEAEAALLPVKKTPVFIPDSPLGRGGKGFLGDSFYTAENPDFGAVFTYFLKEAPQTKRQKRRKEEAKLVKEGADTPYPTWDELREEAREEAPALIFTVRDAEGQVVRRLTAAPRKGMHRLTWDLRYPASSPVRLGRSGGGFFGGGGPPVAPGAYRVEMAMRADGEQKALGEPQTFEVYPLGNTTLPAADRAALAAFQKKTARLQRAVMGTVRALDEAEDRVKHLEAALPLTNNADPAMGDELRQLKARLTELQHALSGDPIPGRFNEASPPAIVDRVQTVIFSHWASTSEATQTVRDAYAIAADAFAQVLPDIQTFVETDLAAFERRLEEAGAPWTPGRVPRWQSEEQ